MKQSIDNEKRLRTAEVKLAQVEHAALEAEPTSKQCEPLNEVEIKIIERAKQRAVTLMDSVTAELCIYYRAEWQKQAEPVGKVVTDGVVTCWEQFVVLPVGTILYASPPTAQAEPDILDSLDWNRLISGERRALKPEHQGWFDKLYASPPTAPEMVSVPREPTEAMIDEGLRQGELYKNAQPLFFSPHVGVAIIYRAMLDVASKESAATQKNLIEDQDSTAESPTAPAADPPSLRQCAEGGPGGPGSSGG